VNGAIAVLVSTAFAFAIGAGTHGGVRVAALAIGAVGMLLAVAATARWPRLLPWVLTSFLLGYTVGLLDRPDLDLRAPFVGAGLLLVGELVSAAGDDLPRAPQRRSAPAVLELLGYGLLAVVIADVVLSAAALRPRGSLILEAVGAVTAVGVFVLIRGLTAVPNRRSPRVPSQDGIDR
jgi:hypothetical protein